MYRRGDFDCCNTNATPHSTTHAAKKRVLRGAALEKEGGIYGASMHAACIFYVVLID
jgi:hypothetical protein